MGHNRYRFQIFRLHFVITSVSFVSGRQIRTNPKGRIFTSKTFETPEKIELIILIKSDDSTPCLPSPVSLPEARVTQLQRNLSVFSIAEDKKKINNDKK